MLKRQLRDGRITEPSNLKIIIRIMRNLKAAKAVDVCYKILGTAIEKRLENAEKKENKGSKEYIAAAVAYIDEHLDNEDLSIVSVATHVYLNPVYFGRVFKNTFHMTFKQYLLQRRMELAKRLLEDGRTSIGNICEQVGISNPSYFSHLFKEYTGQLPRDYKREYEYEKKVKCQESRKSI